MKGNQWLYQFLYNVPYNILLFNLGCCSLDEWVNHVSNVAMCVL